jgi:O-6-methylguanine DNA methyltransferase
MKADYMTKRVACRVGTPLGVFTALYEDGVIRRVLFPDEACPQGFTFFDDTLPFATQINEYFAGKRRRFSLPMLIPGTPFRQSVYRTVVDIPYGCTASYSQVALAAGYPLAMRAVGTAMKMNHLPLLIPCHRVVHKAAKIDAYRGGLGIKSYLLSLEADHS